MLALRGGTKPGAESVKLNHLLVALSRAPPLMFLAPLQSAALCFGLVGLPMNGQDVAT